MFNEFEGGGAKRLPEWKYCLNFSRLFFVLFPALVRVVVHSPLVQSFSYGSGLARLFTSRRGVSLS